MDNVVAKLPDVVATSPVKAGKAAAGNVLCGVTCSPVPLNTAN